jgi:hypothetical protein
VAEWHAATILNWTSKSAEPNARVLDLRVRHDESPDLPSQEHPFHLFPGQLDLLSVTKLFDSLNTIFDMLCNLLVMRISILLLILTSGVK